MGKTRFALRVCVALGVIAVALAGARSAFAGTELDWNGAGVLPPLSSYGCIVIDRPGAVDLSGSYQALFDYVRAGGTVVGIGGDADSATTLDALAAAVGSSLRLTNATTAFGGTGFIAPTSLTSVTGPVAYGPATIVSGGEALVTGSAADGAVEVAGVSPASYGRLALLGDVSLATDAVKADLCAPRQADLAVTLDGPTTLPYWGSAKYTLTVTNNGPATAGSGVDASLSTNLPFGSNLFFSINAFAPDGTSCYYAACFADAALRPGDSESFTFFVGVGGSAPYDQPLQIGGGATSHWTPAGPGFPDPNGAGVGLNVQLVVHDTTAPSFTSPLPLDITAEATGPDGARVPWNLPSAVDPDDSSTVDCAPQSGSMFPLGVTPVTCTATDTHGNSSAVTFHVRVQDTTPPVITGLGTLTLEADSPFGVQHAHYSTPYLSPAANDAVDGPVPLVCTPADGSALGFGQTLVACTATDSHGNWSSGQLLVNVVDTTPPVVQNVPGDVTLEATSPGGAYYTIPSALPAVDTVDGQLFASCPYQSLWPIGTSVVACSAQDRHGNVGYGVFRITVRDTTAPTVACDRSTDGVWHNANITVNCWASDAVGFPGGVGTTFSFGSQTSSVPQGTETTNAPFLVFSYCDTSGNCTTTAAATSGWKVDLKAPTVQITSPSATTYLLGQAVGARYGCADTGSGTASCSGSAAIGGAVDTSSVGAKTFTVDALDNVGNASSASVPYVVAYGVSQLFSSTVATRQLEIKLVTASGTNVSSAAVPVTITALDGAPFADAFGYAKNTASYKWTPSAKTASGTHTLTFTAGSDPTVHTLTWIQK